MAPKNLVLIAALILLVAAVGQVRCVAPLPLIPATISGIVPCSIGSNINASAVPPFANATVQLVCGGTAVTSVTTNGNGFFNITLNLANLQTLLSSILSNRCSAVVTTPLVACNASLAGVDGTLNAALQLLSITKGILTFIPVLFSFIPLLE